MAKEKGSISFLRLCSRILHVARPRSIAMVINVIGVIIMAFNSPYIAWATKYLVDNVVNGVSREVWKGIFFLVGGYMAFGVINYSLNAVPNLMADTKIRGDIRKRILDHLFSTPHTYMQNKPIGEIMCHLEDQTYTVGPTCQRLILGMVSILISLMATMSYLFVLVNYRILLMVFPLLICKIMLPYFLRKRMTYLSEQNTEIEVSIKTLVSEILGALPEIKNFQMKDWIVSRYNLLLQRWIQVRKSKGRLQVISDTSSFLISWAMNLIIFFVGGTWVLNGQMSLGSLLAAMELVSNLYFPFREAAELWSALQSVHGDLVQIESVFQQPTEDSVWAEMSASRTRISGVTPHADKEGLVVNELSFAYPNTPGQIHSVSFSANPSEITLIIGPSGSGKSTLLQVLAGLLPTFEGEIRLYGTSYNQLSPEILRTKVCLLEQDSYLFSTSILENITMVRQDIPRVLLEEVLEVLQLKSVIEAHADDPQDAAHSPQKTLSGGEKQRVALARALVMDTPVLLLDEPTSAVDEPNTLRIVQYLAKHKKNKIIIIVTHEPVYIPYADKIIFMEHGKVQCAGKHEELLRQNARYAAFYASMETFVKGVETA